MDLIKLLHETLPPILWRNQWDTYKLQYGIPFSRGTMANRDSQGRGPKAGKLGNKIYYTKDDYLDWLENLTTEQAA